MNSPAIKLFIFLFLSLQISCDFGGSPKSSPSPLSFFSPNTTPREDYQVPPKDLFAEEQWHLNNSGQQGFANQGGTPEEDINHDPVREMGYTGLGITIALSDNGTQENHPDLGAQIDTRLSRNYQSSDPAGWHGVSSDNQGSSSLDAHGTATAGIITAVDGNGIGIMGTAPRAVLAPFLYIGTGGSVAKDIDQSNGPFDIFNYSYGRDTCDFVTLHPAHLSQLKYGARELRNKLGAIYVKAAGNEYKARLDDCVDGALGYYYGNANLEEDHSHPETLVVAALNANGSSASYSSPGSSIWISAPGGEFGYASPGIITTDTTGCNRGIASEFEAYTDFDKGLLQNNQCDYTSTMNGTSASAPIVSGAVAILLEANPLLSWRDIKYILAKTARKVDDQRGAVGHPDGHNLFSHVYQEGWTTNNAGFHFHNWYGFGALDLEKAVDLAKNYPYYLPDLQETNWTHQSGVLNLEIPDTDAAGVENSIFVSERMNIFTVQLKFTIEHTYAGDIGIELTSPGGTKSILLNINSNIIENNISDGLLLSNAFFGEVSRGSWRIKVIDGNLNDEGRLVSWKLNFYGVPLSVPMINNIGSNPLSNNIETTSKNIRLQVEQNEINVQNQINKSPLLIKSSNQETKTKSQLRPNSRILIIEGRNLLHHSILINNETLKESSSLEYPDSTIIKAKIVDNQLHVLTEGSTNNTNNINDIDICGPSHYLVKSKDQVFWFKENNKTVIQSSYFPAEIGSLKCHHDKFLLSKKDDHLNNHHLMENGNILTQYLSPQKNIMIKDKDKVYSFPKGFEQLKHYTVYSMGSSHKENYLYLGQTTVPLSSPLTGEKSYYLGLINTQNNEISVLQLDDKWRLSRKISSLNILGINLFEKHVYLLTKDSTNKLTVHVIDKNEFQRLQ